MPDDRDDSLAAELPPSPIHVAMKWIGVITALSALVGYGIWIGTIQNSIQTLKSDVVDNEKAHRVNARKIAEAETRERDRLNRLSKSVLNQFNSDKDELWELKMAMAAVNQRVATYHGGGAKAPSPSYGGWGSGGGGVGSVGEGASRTLSPAAKRREVAKQADALVEGALEPDATKAPPLPTF